MSFWYKRVIVVMRRVDPNEGLSMYNLCGCIPKFRRKWSVLRSIGLMFISIRHWCRQTAICDENLDVRPIPHTQYYGLFCWERNAVQAPCLREKWVRNRMLVRKKETSCMGAGSRLLLPCVSRFCSGLRHWKYVIGGTANNMRFEVAWFLKILQRELMNAIMVTARKGWVRYSAASAVQVSLVFQNAVCKSLANTGRGLADAVSFRILPRF
jgi:hypothetical protein